MTNQMIKRIVSLITLLVIGSGCFVGAGCNLITDKIDLRNDSLDDFEWDWSYSFPQQYHLKGIWGFSTENIFAVGDNGTVLHYNGIEWQSLASNTTVSLFDVWGTSPNNVFAVGASGTIFHYDGTNWNHEDSVDTEDLAKLSSLVYRYDGTKWGWTKAIELKRVWGTSADNIYIIPYALGIVLHYDGRIWSIEQIPEEVHLIEIWGTSPDNIYAIGDDGYLIFHWDGKDWEVIQHIENPYQNYCDIWGRSSSDIYVGGTLGNFQHFNGTRWHQINLVENNNNDIGSVWGRSESGVFVTGDFGLVYYDGSKWYSCENNLDKYIFDIWGDITGEIFAVGEDGIILTSKSN